MKAIVIHEYGGPEVLSYEDVADPVAGPGEVVVGVHAVSVNRVLDVALREGRQLQRGITLPLTPGVDPSGVIAQVGDGVDGLAVGDRVAVLSHVALRPGENSEAARDARGQARMIGVHVAGGDAEYVKVPHHLAYPIPDGVSFADATAIARHGPTAYNLLFNMAGLKAGETVLIMGAAGNLGTMGIQLAKSAGATVIAAAGADDRVAFGRALGADFGVNYRSRDLAGEVRRLTGGRGADVLYDNIADPEVLPKAIAALARRGRMVTAGAHAGPLVTVDFYVVYHNQLTIMGSPGSRYEDLAPCFAAAAAGRLRARIERVMKLSEAAEAHRLVAARPGLGKIILDPTLG